MLVVAACSSPWRRSAGPTVAGSAGSTPTRPTPAAWTVYHHDPAGTGVAAGPARWPPAHRAGPHRSSTASSTASHWWLAAGSTSPPSDDTVYALSSATGPVVWSTHLATPVPASTLPCGDIEPTVGITGTPVIDPARGELFVVADELVHGRPAHVLVGLSAATGRDRVDRACRSSRRPTPPPCSSGPG